MDFNFKGLKRIGYECLSVIIYCVLCFFYVFCFVFKYILYIIWINFNFVVVLECYIWLI